MTFQPGQTYRMKTYIHNFLDTVIVLAIYTENGSQTVIVQRPNGQIIDLTEQDIAGADYYLLDDGLNDDNTNVDEDDEDDEDNDEDLQYHPDGIFVIL